MKFAELERGARFRYQGRVYVKTGPLTAADAESGAQRMIPRYAVLQPTDGQGAALAAPSAPDPVREAMTLIVREAEALLDALGASPAQRARFAQAQAAAWAVLDQAAQGNHNGDA